MLDILKILYILALIVTLIIIVSNAKVEDTRGNVSKMTVGQALVCVMENRWSEVE